MAVHFISDLHLQDARPGITRILLEYLAGCARDADALYVLGDLFEYWMGDDVSIGENREVVDAFAAVGATGVPVFYMHGNRDFLIGEDFAKAAGARILPDPAVIDLLGTRTLLMHGDTLCIDDVKYQAFRVQVRDLENQRRFLALPAEQRRQIAGGLRQTSRSEQAGKSMEIMDVNADAVTEALRTHDVTRLIHGHTHRPAIHHFDVDGHAVQRIVLSDWHQDRGNVLVCDGDGCRLEDLGQPPERR